MWHVKICHDAKVVSWLLTEMTTTSSELEDVEVAVKDSEGFGLKVTCNLCVRKNGINIERERAKSGQEQQAQKMVSLSPTQDLQQLMLGQTLRSGCLTLIEDI